MEFVKGVMDYGIAPEVYVDGVERVAMPSPGIVRITLFAPFHLGDRTELRTALHLLWGRESFLATSATYERARAAVAFSEGFRIVRRE